MLPTRRALLSIACLAVLLPACHDVHFEPRGGDGEITIFDDLFSVTSPSPDLVLASGYWGSIYRSADGGQTWELAETGTKRLIYDISMADDQNGWAVGQLGMTLRTTDGGKTWTSQSTPKDDQGVHLFSVQAVDANRAIAVGEWGTRIVTSDGGTTWRDESLTVSQEHPQFVWLTTPDQEKIRRGEKVFDDVTLNDVSCLPDKPHCWIIGEFAYLFRSEDGGETWERGEIRSGIDIAPLELGYNQIAISDADREQVALFANEIADQQHLNIAVQPRVSAAEVAAFGKAEDPFPLFEIIEARTQEVQGAIEAAGILSDRIRRRGAPPWDFEDFIEGDPEFLNRYLNGRTAETPQIELTIAQNPYLFTVRFADENEGYISGLGGVVLRSSDGGRSWTYEDIGLKMAVFSVFPRSGAEAIVVGEKGLIRGTEDGGKTWSTWGGFPTIFTYMRDIEFSRSGDGQVGYIIGQRGMVLRTDDGGRSWTEVLPSSVQQVADAG